MFSLGINYSQMHDSSASIVRDGELLFAVAEERLSRTKHDARFPSHAIQACLDLPAFRADQFDLVCFGWPPPGRAVSPRFSCFANGSAETHLLNALNPRDISEHVAPARRRETIPRAVRTDKGAIRFVDHHLAHAISAYAYSGYDEATVLVMDGRGAWEATSHLARPRRAARSRDDDSVAEFRRIVLREFTGYLGFIPTATNGK